MVRLLLVRPRPAAALPSAARLRSTTRLATASPHWSSIKTDSSVLATLSASPSTTGGVVQHCSTAEVRACSAACLQCSDLVTRALPILSVSVRWRVVTGQASQLMVIFPTRGREGGGPGSVAVPWVTTQTWKWDTELSGKL